jgi:hypothetical protein
LENIQNDAVYSASNGLNKVGNDVQLGGDFTAAVTIDTQSFTFRMDSEGDPNRLSLLGGTNQLQLGQYGSGVLTGAPVYGLAVEADGKVVETDLYTPNPKIYAGKLAQVGAAAPTATVYYNDTELTFVWSRDDNGDYYVTASGPMGNVTGFLNGGNSTASGESVIYNMVQATPTAFRVTTWDTISGALLDGFIANATFEIRIYA